MTRKPLYQWLYSIQEYSEESKQEEIQGTAVKLSRKDKRDMLMRSKQVLFPQELPPTLDFNKSEMTLLEVAMDKAEVVYHKGYAPPADDPSTKIEAHFMFTACHPAELVALYQLESNSYKGPLLILGHAREIERELKHNLFLSAPSFLHDEVSDYFDSQDRERFSFMIEALAGNTPITLGIIECWLRALGHLQDERAKALHPIHDILNNNRMYLLTREPTIEKMYRFRKLRNAATHDDVAEGQVDEFFQVTYSLPSFSKWVDDDFQIPETASPGFFSDYLATGHRPFSQRL